MYTNKVCVWVSGKEEWEPITLIGMDHKEYGLYYLFSKNVKNEKLYIYRDSLNRYIGCFI